MRIRLELFVRDPDHSARFFCDALGFARALEKVEGDELYIAVQRDEVRIALLSTTDFGLTARMGLLERHRRPPVGTEIVLEVPDLEEAARQVEAAGYPLDQLIRKQPWGLRDFRVVEPGGYYIRVTTLEQI